MKSIGLITNASEYSGVGSRAYHLFHQIGKQEDIDLSLVMLDGEKRRIPLLTKEGLGEVSRVTQKPLARLPGILGSKSISWIRLARSLPTFDIYDISNQTLSFIAKKRRPNIVTVHDIIELTDPQDKRAYLLNKYLLSGITHADKIVAVSEYTKRSIVDYFKIPATRITVINNGVDTVYKQISDFKSSLRYHEIIHKYKLQNKAPILLSVGSEHPRKNMKTILETVAILKKQYPGVILLKVGDPGLSSGRREMLEHMDRLQLRSQILFLGRIQNEHLNELYNIADALLFASTHEGFGLPPLEAIASGCPVVCSNTTSLPEVVGDGASMHDPQDAQAFADSVMHIMNDNEYKNKLVQNGTKRAALFSWEKAATQTLTLYRN